LGKAIAQSQEFSEWFKTRAWKEDVPSQIKEFSRGPSNVAKRFSGYLINGYIFHDHEAGCQTQNSKLWCNIGFMNFKFFKCKGWRRS